MNKSELDTFIRKLVQAGVSAQLIEKSLPAKTKQCSWKYQRKTKDYVKGDVCLSRTEPGTVFCKKHIASAKNQSDYCCVETSFHPGIRSKYLPGVGLIVCEKKTAKDGLKTYTYKLKQGAENTFLEYLQQGHLQGGKFGGNLLVYK